jgi:hypothetical protein
MIAAAVGLRTIFVPRSTVSLDLVSPPSADVRRRLYILHLIGAQIHAEHSQVVADIETQSTPIQNFGPLIVRRFPVPISPSASRLSLISTSRKVTRHGLKTLRCIPASTRVAEDKGRWRIYGIQCSAALVAELSQLGFVNRTKGNIGPNHGALATTHRNGRYRARRTPEPFA